MQRFISIVSRPIRENTRIWFFNEYDPKSKCIMPSSPRLNIREGGYDRRLPIPWARKHGTCTKRGNTCNRTKRGKACNLRQTRENEQTVPRKGKHATCAKHGKICNLHQARETMQPVMYQARENMQPVQSTGNHTTCTKRGKICNRYKARGNMQPMSTSWSTKKSPQF